MLRRADFQLCYRDGRKRHGRLLILFVRANGLDEPRLGVTVTKKVGDSVQRHRIKRVLKEAFRRDPSRGDVAPADIVAHVRPGARSEDAALMAAELVALLPRRR